MFVSWIEVNINIFAQLSIIDGWNKNKFTELIPDMLRNVITITLPIRKKPFNKVIVIFML